uniref:VWFA domain-containing protein n=1 Tax=Panagrolaimus superbus TaxID=310955 RepID=A0A914Z8N3_9BILA
MGYNDITAGLVSLQSHLTNLRPNHKLSVILITYNDDYFDIINAIPEAKKIPGNIIIVAVNTIAGNLYYLSGTVIQTDKYFNWNTAAQINAAICQGGVSPSPLPTTPSPSPTSTVTGPTRHGVSIYTLQTVTPQSTPQSSVPSSPPTGSSSSPTTSVVTQTSVSTSPTSTPAPGSYYPCQNWITVLADNSNKLSAAQFQVIKS